MLLVKYLNIKTIVSVITGAIVGFGYFYFVGCKSGSCPITGSPYISTLYGAVIGLLFSLSAKKKKEDENANNN